MQKQSEAYVRGLAAGYDHGVQLDDATFNKIAALHKVQPMRLKKAYQEKMAIDWAKLLMYGGLGTGGVLLGKALMRAGPTTAGVWANDADSRIENAQLYNNDMSSRAQRTRAAFLPAPDPLGNYGMKSSSFEDKVAGFWGGALGTAAGSMLGGPWGAAAGGFAGHFAGDAVSDWWNKKPSGQNKLNPMGSGINVSPTDQRIEQAAMYQNHLSNRAQRIRAAYMPAPDPLGNYGMRA